MNAAADIKNYSQNQEQQAILVACPEQTGKFLDIGAWNPTDKSNTRALFERGWSGVMCEPSPKPFADLHAEYGKCDRITLLNAAVGFETGYVPMWVTADAVSTLEQAQYEKWKDHAHFEGVVQVRVMTVDEILAVYGPFDFISIDAEGTSVDLLHRVLDLGERPRCICVEHDERVTEALSHATSLGYSCTYTSGENLVLVRQ